MSAKWPPKAPAWEQTGPNTWESGTYLIRRESAGDYSAAALYGVYQLGHKLTSSATLEKAKGWIARRRRAVIEGPAPRVLKIWASRQ